jgi:hypothetical protein
MDNRQEREVTQEACLSEPSPNDEVAGIPFQENKIRQIEIRELNRGYMVSVGCHNFALSTKTELMIKLEEYINEPAKTEKKWFAGELF